MTQRNIAHRLLPYHRWHRPQSSAFWTMPNDPSVSAIRAWLVYRK